MQTITIANTTLKVGFSFRAIKNFEEIAKKPITQCTSTWDNVLYFYSTIKALNPGFNTDLETFLNELDNHPELLIQFETMEIAMQPEQAAPTTAKKKWPTNQIFMFWMLSLLLFFTPVLLPIISIIAWIGASFWLLVRFIATIGKKPARMKEQEGLKTFTTIETRKFEGKIGSAPDLKTNTLDDVGTRIDATTEKAKQLKDESDNIASEQSISNVQALSNSFSTLGSAIGGTAGSFMQFAAEMLTLIPQLISQILAMTVAKQGEAIAGGVAASQSVPFPFNIVAIATTVGSIIAAFSKIPKFATGGVVPGASFMGDNVLARVNSGEEILTRNDPRHRNNRQPQQQQQLTAIPADIKLMDDHILISYKRAAERLRSRT